VQHRPHQTPSIGPRQQYKGPAPLDTSNTYDMAITHTKGCLAPNSMGAPFNTSNSYDMAITHTTGCLAPNSVDMHPQAIDLGWDSWVFRPG